VDSSTDEDLSEDQIFDLLSASRRRAVLRLLAERDGEMSFANLTNEITAREYGADGDAGRRKTVYVSLYQTHVPKLVDAGVLTHDDDTKMVALTGPWRQLVAYLEFDPNESTGLLSRVLGRTE
jgi:DNA-binding transcriptional ArsR family regulator